LVALQEGEVQAANLLDPEIPIAEARGLRKLVQGEFLITFWVSPTISQKTLGRFFGALRLAEEALERNTERYLHLWERNVPLAPAEGDYDCAAFGRGEKLIFEPYSLEMFEDAIQFAQAWGLHEPVRESNYERLVAPLPIQPGRTRNPRGRGRCNYPASIFASLVQQLQPFRTRWRVLRCQTALRLQRAQRPAERDRFTGGIFWSVRG
jgi:hypothetical protein